MQAWFELTVKAPVGNGYINPQAMKRVDQHINKFLAVFHAPEGTPIQNVDGSFDLRVYEEAMLPIVKGILTDHYGLEITRESRYEN